MRTIKFGYVLLFFLIFPFCAFAQREFGTIQGTISDIDGGMIPGATVTASSASLIGETANTFSAQDGFYRFPALSPGVYEVKAELIGFQTVAHSSIRVLVGNTVTVNFAWQMLQVSEALEVSGAVPLVDLKSSAVPYTIPAEAVQNLPKPTEFLNLLSLTPGVGDDLVAYGAAGASANRIGLDGVDISSPKSGGLLLSFSQNWVEEVQVQGIAASAEYGGFTGANFNFVTRSGGNDFHGLAETFFANEKLVGSNVPHPGPEDAFKLFDTSVQIGGPLIPNKLSFFSGARYFYNQTSPFGYPGVRTDEQPMAILKLTSRLDQKNTLQGFIQYDYHRFDGVGAGFGVDPVATVVDYGPETSWNSTWISLLGSDTVLETRFGGFWHHQELSTRNTCRAMLTQ